MSQTAADASTGPLTSRSGRSRDLHFDLSFLGPEHAAGDYTLRAAGRRYKLQRHSAQTLIAHPPSGGARMSHFAAGVETAPDVVELLRVYGSAPPNGLTPLSAIAVSTPSGKTSFDANDVAQALVFLNPTITVLTPKLADTVLTHVAGAATLPGLQFAISTAGASWCTPEAILDAQNNPILGSDGKPLCNYVLNTEVLNNIAPVSGPAKAMIYSDTSLLGARWKLAPGVAQIDMGADMTAMRSRASRKIAAANSSSYTLSLQDGGPNFGLSVQINGLSDDLVLDLTVTNSYVRHTSVFVSFLKADNQTAMVVPDNVWTSIAKGAMAAMIEAWMQIAQTSAGQEFLSLLESSDNTLKWCGNVGAESTFLGVPISSTNIDFTFGMPSDQGPVGKIRLLVGSLGVNSQLDWDPTAAWLGICMTALIDLAIPTYALVTTAGEQSNTLFDAIFKSPGFLLSTAWSVFTVAKDIITGSANLGDDFSAALTSLADSLVTKVLTSAEVIAGLAAYFGAEEAEEAIPIVGWAMKALAMEAATEQLAQTIGEVIGSPRVVEFDLTVTMNAEITLVPDPATDNEFPATATNYAITAQYTGGTTRVCTGSIADPKVASIVIDWQQIPVGGTVVFVVALFDRNGWGVGKGTSASVANQINGRDHTGQPALTLSVSVQQKLYPLDAATTYLHSQLLTYSDDAGDPGYRWQDTAAAPTETAYNLGSGPSGHVLQALAGLTLSDDAGLLGYSWEASGLGIPAVDGDDSQTELFTMQNIGFKPIQGGTKPTWPNAGYMTAPAGYSKAPLLLYVRTIHDTTADAAGPGFFFLDPTGDSTNGFHLRQVVPVTDPSVPMGDKSRQFQLATGSSWGRFSQLPTSMAIHSNGYVLAVNPRFDVVQILRLPTQAAPDADAPWAFIPVGPGTAPGRVAKPALTAIRPDQTILVLEAGNQRIQAFSLGGHPVKAFSQSDTPFWIPLVPHAAAGVAVVYLSMSVDVANYVYVLSQNGDGYDATDFNLDIYTPTGQHLLYQQGLVAAGLAVDLWRNVYTLNFQQIAGPAGQTQPSLSEFIPSTPKQP